MPPFRCAGKEWLRGPRDVAVAANGDLVVADGGNNRLYVVLLVHVLDAEEPFKLLPVPFKFIRLHLQV